MEKNIKDFLHYYINRVNYRLRYVDNPPGEWTIWSNLTPGRYARAVEDLSVEQIQIELRKMESMTYDEWQEIRFHLSADIVLSVPLVLWPDRPRWVIILENRVRTNTLKLLDGIELIKRGYDIFGFIESGLAIEKQPVNSKTEV